VKHYLFFLVVFLVVGLCLQAHDSKRKRLPLGDGKISSTPKIGYVVPCLAQFPGGGGAHRIGDWVKNGTWDPTGKPIVEGNITWPNAQISVAVEGDFRVVRANNLPKHATGEFPIRPGTKAFDYDRNPNSIGEQNILLRLPVNPLPASNPNCVPLGMIGFALSGVAIFNAFDLDGRDAPAYEIQDKCNGHPEPNRQYHYHHWSPCIPDVSGSGNHSALVGWMIDGFPIFGLKGKGGKKMVNADLDACHGHSHVVEIDGQSRIQYHYHFTEEYPYTVGCLAGPVDPSLLRKRPPAKPFGAKPPPPKPF
jgi:hypothetical protein